MDQCHIVRYWYMILINDIKYGDTSLICLSILAFCIISLIWSCNYWLAYFWRWSKRIGKDHLGLWQYILVVSLLDHWGLQLSIQILMLQVNIVKTSWKTFFFSNIIITYTELYFSIVFIAGASGGIYALIAAHLSTMILNWKEDNAIKIRKVIHKPMTKIIRIIFISFLTIHDFAIAIYETYVLKKDSQTGYVGHLCGAIAGILVGFFILKNRRWEMITVRSHLIGFLWQETYHVNRKSC